MDIVFDENADKYAYRPGFVDIGQSGDVVKILNDQTSQHKAWQRADFYPVILRAGCPR